MIVKRTGLFLVAMIFVLTSVVVKAEDKDCKNAFVTDAVYSVLGAVNLQYQREISKFFNFDVSIATVGYGEILLPDLTLRINPFGEGLKGFYFGPKVLGVYYVVEFRTPQIGLGFESGYEWILWNFLVINPSLDMRYYFYESWDSGYLIPFPVPCLRIGYAW